LVTEVALELSSLKGRVVVLSPYQGQVDLIKRRLKKKANVGVFTVDGFQGKEADFVLLSMVRNNDKTSGARWGFVSDPNRLNVALSRAREGLAVFTSMEHLEGSEFEEGEDHLSMALGLIEERGARVTPEEMRGLLG
jgi:superfamily I DNA and/or RNA helicase